MNINYFQSGICPLELQLYYNTVRYSINCYVTGHYKYIELHSSPDDYKKSLNNKIFVKPGSNNISIHPSVFETFFKRKLLKILCAPNTHLLIAHVSGKCKGSFFYWPRYRTFSEIFYNQQYCTMSIRFRLHGSFWKRISSPPNLRIAIHKLSLE